MLWYEILILIIIILLLIYCSICFIIAFHMISIVTNPYCMPYEESIEKLTKENRLEKNFKDIYKSEEFVVNSKYGYKLKARYIKKRLESKESKEKVVVLVHGWSSSHLAMYVYAKMYLDLGFHVFLYDHRNHMFSDKTITTMGDKEADDLESVIVKVKEKMGSNIIIGTHGESLGATTIMIHAGRYHSVDFACEDCGYNSIKELLTYQCVYLKKFPFFPTLLFASLIFKIKTKISFKEVDVASYLSTCDDIPMYFIHGDKDHFVPSYMVYKNYDCKNGFKMISIYDCKKHANCVVNNYNEYFNDLTKFLNDINIIN